MSKPWNPGKETVQLRPVARPSRIRRDPVHVQQDQQLARNAWWESREWEIRLAVVGVLLFAVGIAALWIGISEVTSH